MRARFHKWRGAAPRQWLKLGRARWLLRLDLLTRLGQGTWATNRTLLVAAESPALYGSTLYVLGLFWKDVNIGTGDIFGSNEHASTNGGGDDRDGRDR